MPNHRKHLRRALPITVFGAALVTLIGCPPGATTSEENAGDPPGEQSVPNQPGSIDVAPLTVEGDGEGGSVQQTILGRFITLTATPADGFLFGGWLNMPANDNPLTIDGTGLENVQVLFLPDADGDGVSDDDDGCPGTPSGAAVGVDGCSRSQRDDDGDLVSDADDLCPGTAPGSEVDADGCAAAQRDTDGDGVTDDSDGCPETAESDATLVDDSGCAPAQLDADGDGVSDDVDQCPETSPLEAADENGCGVSQRDTDGDGVSDQDDQCPDTAEGAEDVNDRGCAPAQRDSDFDGVKDDVDECPDTESGVAIDDVGCELVFVDFGNDECDGRRSVTDGVTLFTTENATTSTPPIEGACDALGGDVWFCYEATCTSLVTVSLCGSLYDTMLAVYPDCACPPEGEPIACDDDFCGGGGGSRVSFAATAGETYLIRAGGWSDFDGNPSLGQGKMTISCAAPEAPSGCGGEAGDCFAGNGSPGCGDAECCEAVCSHVPFCCEQTWSEACAVIANDICMGGQRAECGNGVVELGEECDPPDNDTCGEDCKFLPVCGNEEIEIGEDCDPPDGTTCDDDCLYIPVCGNNRIERGEQCDPPDGETCDDNCQFIGGGDPCVNGTGDCCGAHANPGCDDEACCTAVCDEFPECCTVEWTEECAFGASILCEQCAPVGCDGAQGDCRTPHPNPGCNDSVCCSLVCAFRPTCCETEWTQECADIADDIFDQSGGVLCGG